MKFTILVLLCLRISIVHAEDPKPIAAPFLPAGFISWFWPSSIVVGDWLYVHGGEIHTNDTKKTTDGQSLMPVPQTYAIDLTKSWTTSDVTAKEFKQIEAFRPSRRPEIFYDKSHHMVYCYGGEYFGPTYGVDNFDKFDANVKPEVWGFTPVESGDVAWSQQFAGSTSNSFLNSSIEYALTASSNEKHFSIGGMTTWLIEDENGPDPGLNIQIVMDEFVTYDYATQEFTNITHANHTFMGEAHFVPHYGEEGILVFFGGKKPDDRGVALTDISATLGDIHIYDIRTGQFYLQHATSAPAGRYSSCSVGVSSADNSSYEIFLYGGDMGTASNSDFAALSTVFILTLPAFTWLEATTPTDYFRSNHKCQQIGPKSISEHNQRQMLSIGGWNPPVNTDWSKYSDPWSSSMNIFDLSALTWNDTYDPNAKAYTKPDVVNNHYLNNDRFPLVWGDAILESIFNNSASATTTGTSPTLTPEAKAGTSVGAIAGGVVGGVVVAALVGFLLFWFCWRKRKANNGVEPDRQDYENVKEMGDGAAIELSVGKDIPRRELYGDNMQRRELPGDDARRELEANEYQPMQEPQELPTGER
ncbi:hypothetical protein V492_05765 [Pseudogymnoascus sp. VKM F-4246]|nr:hypothetical protein V492_05765 [Pseudogymnoascus sp. VKM F-4246]